MMEEIKPTGERLLPGLSDEQIPVHRYYLAYEFGMPFVEENKVLDLGCGEGYGTFYLADKASQIIGVDIDKYIVKHAKEKYQKDNLSFEVMDIKRLDFPDKAFDVVISLHVIEHLHLNKIQEHLQEIKRVLKGNGIYILATPNRKTRLKPGQESFNIYHLHEYNWQELQGLLKGCFNNVKMYGIEASQKAFEQEMQRVRPNTIFDKFISLLARLDIFKIRRLPVLKLFARRLVNLLGGASKIIIKKSKDYIPISAVKKEDFKISDYEAEMTLDLLAVCSKN